MNIRKPKIIGGETHILCARCKQYKKLDDFGFDKRGKAVRRSWCKQCSKENSKIYAHKYRKKYPQKFQEKYREKNREAVNKYNSNNRELVSERNRKWRLNNPEKAKKACRDWYKRTKNKITECLYEGIKLRVNRLKNQNAEIQRKDLWKILGYSYDDFTKHIEKRFQPGMTWGNHGEWEFDHIIPVSFFQFQSHKDVEFKMCWRLENIQPLWKHQNRQKTNKILIA